MVSKLRLPMSMTYDSYSGPDTGAAAYRGHADGGHVESYGTLRTNHDTDVTFKPPHRRYETWQNVNSKTPSERPTLFRA